MAASAKRLWFQVHSWIGLTFGLLLFVVCWSGTFAVFAHEIDWLLDPRVRTANTAGFAGWQAIETNVKAAHPGWTIVAINAPLHPGFAVEVLAEPEPDKLHRIHVDPATATVLGHNSYFNVQRFFRSFHMALFDTGAIVVAGVPLGYLLVAVLAVPLLASLVASLVFHRRWWRSMVRLQVGHGSRVLLSSLHRFVGAWSIWFIALIGATGLWYLAEWYVPYTEPAEAPAVAAGQPLSLDDLADRAVAAYPGLRVQTIASWTPGEVELQGQAGDILVRDRAASVTLDRQTGRIVRIVRPSDMTLLERWTETADPLHFGTWGGLWSRALYFAFGLALSGLILTGAALQVGRQKGATAPARHRPPVLAAYASTIAILAWSVANAMQEVQGYGLGGAWPAVPIPVIAFVGAWCLSTLAALTLWMIRLR
jgi:uncharacterized iron-regulated membrane protein